MSIVEAGLRGGAVAILLLLVVLLLRDARTVQVGRYAALFLLSVAAYVIASSPVFAALDARLKIPIQLVSACAPALFWTAVAALFDDEFKLSWRHVFAWFGLAALSLWQMLDRQHVVALVHEGVSLIFVVLSIWHALVGREADLVEGRRRFRFVVAISTALYIALILVSQLVLPGSQVSAPFSIANAIGLVALTFIFAVSRLSIAREEQFAPIPLSEQNSSSPAEILENGPRIAVLSNGQEAALLKALGALMENDRIYRAEGLSIAVLCGKLGVPEYRLRRLINRQLGHRNFSTFVNGYRLAEAMGALADRGQADVPILTIALDTGFGSVGPFNRAFKAHTGLTPTEYRRRHGTAQEGTAG